MPAAIARFRAALQARPDFADALNNLGFALFQTGQPAQAYELYQKALALQPDFPEALNNLGIFFGRQGDLERARSATSGRRWTSARATARPPTTWRWCSSARGDADGAMAVLQRLLEQNPGFEMTYVTLAGSTSTAGQRREGSQVLERLLQRNPKHPLGLQILRQLREGG